MFTIRPSIASANQLNLERELARLGNQDRYIHFDIEDGNYLKNITFGLKTIAAVSAATKAECDAHIMATDVLRYIEPLAQLKMSAVCFQIELMTHPTEGINRIKRCNMKAGLALDPKTPPEQLEMFADIVDYVLVMTSEPDDADESFRTLSLQKLKRVRELLPERVSVWADGGIDGETIRAVAQSGADTVVLGRAVWKREDPEAALTEYYEAISASR